MAAIPVEALAIESRLGERSRKIYRAQRLDLDPTEKPFLDKHVKSLLTQVEIYKAAVTPDGAKLSLKSIDIVLRHGARDIMDKYRLKIFDEGEPTETRYNVLEKLFYPEGVPRLQRLDDLGDDDNTDKEPGLTVLGAAQAVLAGAIYCQDHFMKIMPSLDAVKSHELRSTNSLRTKQTLAYFVSGAFGPKEGTVLNFIDATDDDNYRARLSGGQVTEDVIEPNFNQMSVPSFVPVESPVDKAKSLPAQFRTVNENKTLSFNNGSDKWNAKEDNYKHVHSNSVRDAHEAARIRVSGYGDLRDDLDDLLRQRFPDLREPAPPGSEGAKKFEELSDYAAHVLHDALEALADQGYVPSYKHHHMTLDIIHEMLDKILQEGSAHAVSHAKDSKDYFNATVGKSLKELARRLGNKGTRTTISIGISHDNWFRNVLGALVGFAAAIAEEYPSPATRIQFEVWEDPHGNDFVRVCRNNVPLKLAHFVGNADGQPVEVVPLKAFCDFYEGDDVYEKMFRMPEHIVIG